MTDEPRTPLSFSLNVNNLSDVVGDGRPPGTATIGAEPSFAQPGYIFVASDPFGAGRDGGPRGVHVSESEARQLRDHLTKLLAEQPIEDEPKARFVADSGLEIEFTPEELLKAEVPEAPTFDPAQFARAVAARERVKRVKRRLRRWPLPQFRLEFKWGRFESVAVRTEDE